MLLTAFSPGAGLTSDEQYPTMAPLSRYLIADRQAEIDLARSAAPPAISLQATIVVLGRHGYETAENGSNGFTCIVERSWMDAFDDYNFWNWKQRAPTCYNAPAARTVMQYTYRRTDLVLAGLSKAQMLQRINEAVAAKQLPTPEPGAMAYMMSKDQYLGDDGKQWYPHVMIYAPKEYGANDGASWGADMRGSPVIYDSQHKTFPEPASRA